MNRDDWLKTLVSDKGTCSNSNLTSKQQELDQKIREHIKLYGSIIEVEGAFGDVQQNKGFVEQYVDTDKGKQIKFYGCSILFKGDILRETIDSVAGLKRVLMTDVEYALKGKVIFMSLKSYISRFVRIYEADLEPRTYRRLQDFSPLPRELIRTGHTLADKIKELDFRDKVKRFIWCVATFIQNDFAYYWRVQDPLSNLDKVKLK